MLNDSLMAPPPETKPANGHNPMRYDCGKLGCFNVKMRPKIEVFADCFPGKIAMTDVDGIVEVNGNLLALEWKSHARIPTGQRLLFERWTRPGQCTVLGVVGDAETMCPSEMVRFWQGRGTWEPCTTLEALKQEIRDWVAWARNNPR